ncbi:MAG TPA: hypothetical protein VF521_03975, partial [Pyrinomonadaceae bacterium]
ERVNAGEVSAAPPKVAPPGVLTAEAVAEIFRPKDVPAFVVELLGRYPRLALFVLIVAVLVALLLALLVPWPAGLLLAAFVLAVGIFLFVLLSRWAWRLRASEAVGPAARTPEAVDALPGVSNFEVLEPGASFTPSGRGPDSVEASRFKDALRDAFEVTAAAADAGRVPVRSPLPLDEFVSDGYASLRPRDTIGRRVWAGVFVPPRVRDGLVFRFEVFWEPMAYPVIDEPMYKPLTQRSSELFLPNINLIEQNSLTLLETNQRFIESYMVGLNHEFARELLWREYPTDQRGSYFRQFWDVHGFFNHENLDDETLKEKLRDIPPLHLWSKFSHLGDHNNREPGTSDKADLVLVIRGELLKRYPTAVIYAHRACWQREEVTPADKNRPPCERSGAIDSRRERRLVSLTAAEEASPPPEKVRTPLYEAKVEPDIYFFGFSLTVEEAKGGTGDKETDDPGWFFVIKERPGEPRFGLDTDKQPQLNDWNDLSWQDVQPKPAGSFIEVSTAPAAFPLVAPGPGDDEKGQQHDEDVHVSWGHSMTSAEMAYILFQAPVLVAVHASEMLGKLRCDRWPTSNRHATSYARAANSATRPTTPSPPSANGSSASPRARRS